MIWTSCPTSAVVVSGSLASKLTLGSSTSKAATHFSLPIVHEYSPASVEEMLWISSLCFLPSILALTLSDSSTSLPFLNHFVIASPLLNSISKTAFSSPTVALTGSIFLVNSGGNSIHDNKNKVRLFQVAVLINDFVVLRYLTNSEYLPTTVSSQVLSCSPTAAVYSPSS